MPQNPYKAFDVAPASKPRREVGRLDPKIRAAIAYRVQHGLAVEEACKLAGISSSTFYKAINRPAGIEAVNHEEQTLIASVERVKGRARARAIALAETMLRPETPWQERRWALELFTRDVDRPQGAAPVSVNIAAPGGYSFAPRPSQVLDITPSPDTSSPRKADKGE